MKLYTEEELLKAIQYGRDYYDGWVMTEPEILKLITPIELPSDEEIESGMNQRLFLSDKNAHFNSGAKAGFKLGAKWMKEQILYQNKGDMCYAFISQIDGKNKKCLKCGKDMFEHYNQNHLGGITY